MKLLAAQALLASAFLLTQSRLAASQAEGCGKEHQGVSENRLACRLVKIIFRPWITV